MKWSTLLASVLRNAVAIFACGVIGTAVVMMLWQLFIGNRQIPLVLRTAFVVVAVSVLTSLIATMAARTRWAAVQASQTYRSFVLGPRPTARIAQHVWWLGRFALISWFVVLLGVAISAILIRAI